MYEVMERSHMPMAVTDPRLPNDPIIFVNAAFSTLTGYAADEVIGRNARFMQRPVPEAAAVEEIEAAIPSHHHVDAEILHYRKDGTPFWNGLFITPLLDKEQNPAFFVVTQIDVTLARKSKSAEAALIAKEKELEEVKERLRATLAISGLAAAWEWNIAERRIFGDTRFAILYGLNTEEAAAGISPKQFFSIIHPDDVSRIRLAVAGMLQGAEVFSKSYRLVLADGSVRWVHARGRCYSDDDGKPVRFNGALVDITEQRRIAEQLRIAQTAGGIGTFEYIDGFGTAVVSDKFCTLLGLQPARDLPVRTINPVVHPMDTPIIDMSVRPAIGDASNVEFRVIRPDNGELRWLTRRGEYLRDAETAGLRFSGVIYDITAAKRTEELLRALNDTLEARVAERTRERDRLWEASQDLYVLCDAEGICKSLNPAWHSELSYDITELLDHPLIDLVHPDDQPALAAAIDRLRHGDRIENLDLRVVSKQGEPRSYSWTYVSQNEVFFASGRDVTRRNELEEQLRQSQKMEAVGQLTGGIAHDFNNLLTGISGSLEMMQHRLDQKRYDDVANFMAAATVSAQRAAALTQRLLAFSRRQSLDIRALDVNILVASMEELLNRTLGEQITLTVKLAPGLWLGLSDANHLESALLNLAINARDAMPDGGELVISTENATLERDFGKNPEQPAEGDYVVVSVRDTGTGMSPETMAKAFDPFFTTKPIGQGTGLGLSMIYGFAKQSGGQVTVESEIGVGTTIKLYIPRFFGEQILEVSETRAPELPSAAGETLLVVEDDVSVRLLVVEFLGGLGYRIIEASDSSSAIPLLKSDRGIDLMVSDIGLPGISGRQLAEIARQSRPELKILFITGYAANATVRSEFLGAGMEMISKPFALELLAVKVREMLE